MFRKLIRKCAEVTEEIPKNLKKKLRDYRRQF